MSQQPPPPPYGAGPPSYYPPPPREKRRRPSAWWFVVGAVMLVGGIGIGVASIVFTLQDFTEVDARVTADGQAQVVELDLGGEEAFLWSREGTSAQCTIIDTETSEEVSTGFPGGTFTRSGGTGSWVAAGTFDPGSGTLEVTCAETGSDVEIGPAVDFGGFFGGIALGILAPLFLGGAGFILLIVIGILYATGRPRTS